MSSAAPLNEPIVRYDQNSNFFCCRECTTHLAEFDELISITCSMKATLQISTVAAVMYSFNWTWIQLALFNNTVNLRFDPVITVIPYGIRVRKAYCNHCGTPLGYRMVDSGEYMLELQTLLFSSGNEILNPEVPANR